MTNPAPSITQAQRDALHARGLTDEDILYIPPEEVEGIIRNVPPERGQKILNGGATPDPDALEQRESINFLQKLRPGGPWLLIAIDPDSGAITARTVRSLKAAATFVDKWNGKRNLYYSVNPTRTELDKKAAKTDIEAIEYALADLDPNEGETSEAAKARYLKALEHFNPKPTALIDSGNGLQGLWRMRERIALGELESGKFGRADQDTIADVEVRIAAIMLRLGAKPGTQNIDRILRLPSTTNLPNAKKRKAGRTECQTKLLWMKTQPVAAPSEIPIRVSWASPSAQTAEEEARRG